VMAFEDLFIEKYPEITKGSIADRILPIRSLDLNVILTIPFAYKFNESI